MTRVLLSSVACVAMLSMLADAGPAEAAKRGNAWQGGRPIIVTDLSNSHAQAPKYPEYHKTWQDGALRKPVKKELKVKTRQPHSGGSRL